MWATNYRWISFLALHLQLVAATVVVARNAFSSPVAVLEGPHRAVAVICSVCFYLLAVQCVLLVPAIHAERLLVSVQDGARGVSEWAHQLSALLGDAAQAVVMGVSATAVMYALHPLNPNPLRVIFAGVCMIVGICAWQALVRCCTVLIRDPRRTYGLLGALLLVGAVFGGLVIRMSALPGVLQWLPHASVLSSVQRALVASELQYGSFSATCAMLTATGTGTGTSTGTRTGTGMGGGTSCPQSLQFSGDGTDEGNLGRYYLEVRHGLLSLESIWQSSNYSA